MEWLDRVIDNVLDGLQAELPGFVRGGRSLSRPIDGVITWIGAERGRFNTQLIGAFHLDIGWFDVADPGKTKVWTRQKLMERGLALRYRPFAASVTVSNRDWVSVGEVLPVDVPAAIRRQLTLMPELQRVKTFDDAVASFGINKLETQGLSFACARRGRHDEAAQFAAKHRT